MQNLKKNIYDPSQYKQPKLSNRIKTFLTQLAAEATFAASLMAVGVFTMAMLGVFQPVNVVSVSPLAEVITVEMDAGYLSPYTIGAAARAAYGVDEISKPFVILNKTKFEFESEVEKLPNGNEKVTLTMAPEDVEKLKAWQALEESF